MNDYTEPQMKFANEEEAATWMYEYLDDPCTDNYRFAYLDDTKAVQDYEIQKEDGCCGFFDKSIIVGGREAYIGCNYGH
jgi:hypothetical protein